jgi:lysozyme
MNIAALKAQLVRHEDLRLKPYKDSLGILTIGVGRNLEHVGITEAEAMVLLGNDIIGVFDDLDRVFPWWRQMTEERQLVIADMCFNLGIKRLLGFVKTMAAMQSGRYEVAAVEMLDSKWAQQVGKRAITLANMMKGV